MQETHAPTDHRFPSVTTTSSMEKAAEAFRLLTDWLTDDHSLGLDLHCVEGELADRGREVLRLLLEAHIRERGTGKVGPAILVKDGCREREHTEKREHERHLKTVFGAVEIVRQAYSLAGESSVHPLDQALPLPGCSFSYELQRRAVKRMVQGPLNEARDSLDEITGVKIGKGSLETIVEQAALDFREFYEQKKTLDATETGPILVAEADGKGVPMIKPVGTVLPAHRTKGQKSNKKKMATMGAVYTIKPRIRTPEEVTESLFRDRRKLTVVPDPGTKPKRIKPESKRVWASLKREKPSIFSEIADECERRDPTRDKTWLALTDGERALQKEVDKKLPEAIHILDIMHALPRLWKVANIFHKEGSKEAIKWVKVRTLRILQGEVVNVVRGIRISATKRNEKLTKKQRKTIATSTNYLRKNRDSMRYQEYLAQGFPIATGNIEGAARHLVKDRMERSGMRWSMDGAEAMLALRAVYISGDFEDYWDFHVSQEQGRIHPPGAWRPLKETG